MDIDIISRPAGSAVHIKLNQSEGLTVEVGGMIAMSPQLQVETTTKSKGGSGGIMKGIKRMFSGESLFLNHFTATAPSQELIIGPKMIGDVVLHPLTGGSLVVQGLAGWLRLILWKSTPHSKVSAQPYSVARVLGQVLGTGPVLLNSLVASTRWMSTVSMSSTVVTLLHLMTRLVSK